MTDVYSCGTVHPSLPLTERMKRLLDWSTSSAVLDENGVEISPRDMDPADPMTDEEFESRRVIDLVANQLGLTEKYDEKPVTYEPTPSRPGFYNLFVEDGASDETALVLATVLEWLPDEWTHIYFEGATWASAAAPGQFGGWACFITRDSIAWTGTDAWVRQQQEEVGPNPVPAEGG